MNSHIHISFQRFHISIQFKANKQKKLPKDAHSLTFPEEWRYLTVHIFFRDQAEVGHVVALYALEGAMLCYLLDDFLTQISAQEVRYFP